MMMMLTIIMKTMIPMKRMTINFSANQFEHITTNVHIIYYSFETDAIGLRCLQNRRWSLLSEGGLDRSCPSRLLPAPNVW